MEFQFKKFSLSHGQSSMRLGTDAVLLGAWAGVEVSKKILDIGTGCGIIALMAAQRNLGAVVHGIDIHAASAEEAGKNFDHSPWKNRLSAATISLQDFVISSPEPFDHILSNPPYFFNSLPAKGLARQLARHMDTLTPSDFFKGCQTILDPMGKISLIIPHQGSGIWLDSAGIHGFQVSRSTLVHSYPGKVAERILLEFALNPPLPEQATLFIRNGRNQTFTDQYQELTGDFYL